MTSGDGVRRPLNFALVGASGFVAPRHMRAIAEVGGRLVAAVDPHDAAGALDRWAPEALFFTSMEEFERHLEGLRRGPPEGRVDRVVICSPNGLHGDHIRRALRGGADVLCEKPLVVDPGDLDALEGVERETGRRVRTVLQLRLHPAAAALRERLRSAPAGRVHEVDLVYVTRRGPWYHASWKGDEARSGGLAMNIGVHLFDLLIWLFGAAGRLEVRERERGHLSGTLELERARVRWFLSVEARHLPEGKGAVHRVLAVDGEEVDLSAGMEDLHTAVHREVLGGGGPGIAEARPSIELVARVRGKMVSDTSLPPPGRRR